MRAILNGLWRTYGEGYLVSAPYARHRWTIPAAYLRSAFYGRARQSRPTV
jgi:hypothetical protein